MRGHSRGQGDGGIFHKPAAAFMLGERVLVAKMHITMNAKLAAALAWLGIYIRYCAGFTGRGRRRGQGMGRPDDSISSQTALQPRQKHTCMGRILLKHMQNLPGGSIEAFMSNNMRSQKQAGGPMIVGCTR